MLGTVKRVAVPLLLVVYCCIVSFNFPRILTWFLGKGAEVWMVGCGSVLIPCILGFMLMFGSKRG